jgi:hypothetical protein
MGITAIVCIAAVVVAIVIILTILVYNQMLLLNEVNKRLLLMTKESIDKERYTQEQLQEALVELEQQSDIGFSVENSPQYNPEPFHDSDLDL